MGKSGIGVGSASIVLVFAVLCLTVFSLITYVVAGNDRSLVDAKIGLVSGYYEADAMAEQILLELLAADETPQTIQGVNIYTKWDEERGVETTYFFCEISAIKSLYVHLILRDDSFDIITWRMYDTDEWEFDNSINVWTGE
ncbi:MAG: hypothetical protein FWE83_09420 [Oscillospiraceae bacterium]|nr:hypothetical protein [Oscillospiraceae bacterium]